MSAATLLRAVSSAFLLAFIVLGGRTLWASIHGDFPPGLALVAAAVAAAGGAIGWLADRQDGAR